MSPQAVARTRTVAAGLTVVVVVCLAAPAALVALVVLAWSSGGLTGSASWGRLGVLVADGIGWVAWATYVVGLARDIADRLRDPQGRPPAGARSRVAGWVAGMVLIALPGGLLAGSATAGAAAAISVASAPAPAAAPAGVPVATDSSEASPTAAPTGGANAAATTYTVEDGDCLSTIAERFYGTGGDWTTIWSANADALEPTGRRFTDPNLIMPGWTLSLPGVDPPPASTPAPTPALAVGPSDEADEAAPDASPASPTKATGHDEPVRGTAGSDHHQARTAKGQRPRSAPADPSSATQHPPTTLGQSAGSHRVRATSNAGWVLWLPEAAALGVSALVAAAFARRIRRTRARAMAARGNTDMLPTPVAAAVTIESAVAPFEAVPVLDWLGTGQPLPHHRPAGP